MLEKSFQEFILSHTKSDSILSVQIVQELWSGYGQIVRVRLKGGEYRSVIVKKIQFPVEKNHPRGWNTSLSHERKVKSYKVEKEWYENWNKTNDNCKTAKYIHSGTIDDCEILILEDLDVLGFERRKTDLSFDKLKVCLKWLANFHAIHLNHTPIGLWEVGSYWNLSTRPDEFDLMPENELKRNAKKIDSILNNCKYKTIIHGDAKVANFCFQNDLKEVAAVDFQYVGGGCGIKDVAYLISSCLTENESLNLEGEVLDAYFNYLETSLIKHELVIDFGALKEEWIKLYPVAWADFVRFLQGWSPNHRKLNKYSLKQIDIALDQL